MAKKKTSKDSTALLKRSKPVTEKDIAMDLAQKIHQKFDRMVKATILFGSQAKNESSASSDIDIIVVIDDASITWDLELISWYREELSKLVSGMKYKREFHVNTVKLTTWWQDILNGDPVIVNILRYGEALIDSGGFFLPLKALLLEGRIRSTAEAAYAALQRAPSHLARSKAAELGAIEGVYWSMIDSAQAALITAGKVPPSPEHIPEMMNEAFVSRGLIKEGLVRALKDIYNVHKSISHGKINDIKGIEIDNWQETAELFLSEMTRVIDALIETKRAGLR